MEKVEALTEVDAFGRLLKQVVEEQRCYLDLLGAHLLQGTGEREFWSAKSKNAVAITFAAAAGIKLFRARRLSPCRNCSVVTFAKYSGESFKA